MNIRLLVVRRIEVDDALDVVHVDAACRDVGSDQSLEVTGDERRQGPLALRLAAITVDRGRVDARPVEFVGQTIGAALGPAEHDGRPMGADQLSGQIAAVGSVGPPEDMAVARGLGDGLGLDPDRVGLVAAGELAASPSSVAEKSIVCRSQRIWSRSLRTWGMNPMSAIRSASSITTMPISLRSTSPRSARSVNRPGQATAISSPRRRARTWGPNPTPP